MDTRTEDAGAAGNVVTLDARRRRKAAAEARVEAIRQAALAPTPAIDPDAARVFAGQLEWEANRLAGLKDLARDAARRGVPVPARLGARIVEMQGELETMAAEIEAACAEEVVA